MSTLSRRITVPAAILLALAITPALSGCFGNPIEQVIEGATGGEVDLGGNSVPEGFPSEVPLVDGEVLFGAAVGNTDGRIWNVTVQVASAAALDEIVAQLEGAGFTNTDGFGGSTAEGGTAALESEAYGVLVVVTPDGQNGFVANYTVTEKAAQ
jgi:hypothetical protein